MYNYDNKHILQSLFLWTLADIRIRIRHAVIRIEITETYIRTVIRVTAYDKCLFLSIQSVQVQETITSITKDFSTHVLFVGYIPGYCKSSR